MPGAFPPFAREGGPGATDFLLPGAGLGSIAPERALSVQRLLPKGLRQEEDRVKARRGHRAAPLLLLSHRRSDAAFLGPLLPDFSAFSGNKQDAEQSRAAGVERTRDHFAPPSCGTLRDASALRASRAPFIDE